LAQKNDRLSDLKKIMAHTLKAAIVAWTRLFPVHLILWHYLKLDKIWI